MGQAVLQTARIRLVPLGDEHLEHEVELDADPEVMRHLSPTGPRTREEGRPAGRPSPVRLERRGAARRRRPS